MQASETQLRKIIEGTTQYIIPLFQRSYSWGKSQWELLWNDIMELYESENLYPHFFGSIVTMQTDSSPEGMSKYLLIDGQQRLTTIFVLLSTLRDFAKTLNQSKLANQIDDKYLVNRHEESQDYYKLQPTQIDRQWFRQIIDEKVYTDKLTDTGNSLYNCYYFFIRKIKRFKQIELERIKNIICDYFIIVSILLGKDDNPYLVFESLNAKGQPLTQADLIRNYFFMGIESKKQDNLYQEYWLPMQNKLGDNLTEFLRFYLIKKGIVVKQNDVYFDLKEQVSRGNTINYLKDIYKFSNYYAKFLNPEQETNKNIKKSLQRIKSLDIKTVYPFLLNCYDDCQEKRIAELDFINVCQIIENYILRRFICNIPTQGLNKIFPPLYTQITKEINLESSNFLEQLKLILQTQNYPEDSDFKEKIKEVKLYGSNRTQKAKLILESMEESFGHKEQVSLRDLSIEHILPQKLNDWWKSHLGEDWEITHELLLHSLGNLTLTGYNSELSNDTFIDKQKELDKSNLELNKYFVRVSTWKKEDIEKRAEILSDICLQIWSYFGDPNIKNIKEKKVKGSRPKNLIVCGEEYNVKSWRDVLERTLNVIADLEPEKFDEMIELFPRFLAKDSKNLRDTRQLNNGIFVEVNLSSKYIYSFCQKVIETCELSSEDWQVETVE